MKITEIVSGIIVNGVIYFSIVIEKIKKDGKELDYFPEYPFSIFVKNKNGETQEIKINDEVKKLVFGFNLKGNDGNELIVYSISIYEIIKDDKCYKFQPEMNNYSSWAMELPEPPFTLKLSNDRIINVD